MRDQERVSEGSPQDEEPTPYIYHPDDRDLALDLLGQAVNGFGDGFLVAQEIGEAAEGAGGTIRPALVSELQTAFGYQLNIRWQPNVSCEFSQPHLWPEPLDKANADRVQLWEAIAAASAEPYVVARFSDLLFSARKGNVGEHARRALSSYIAANPAGALPTLDQVDALVRGWTVARQTKSALAEDRYRAVFEGVPDLDADGAHPGLVMPFLYALSTKSIGGSEPDSENPGRLLARSAERYDLPHVAEKIASLRRRLTSDPTQLAEIAALEIAAHTNRAASSDHPAVKMVHLDAAVRVAQSRGQSEAAREITAEMQRLGRGDLQMIHFREASDLPPWIPEATIQGYTRGPDWRAGMIRFLLRDPPTGDAAAAWRHARETDGFMHTLFSAAVIGPDNLPKATANTVKEQETHRAYQYAALAAANVGRWEGAGLRAMADAYGKPDQDDLVELFMHLGCQEPLLATSLAKAFHHYWNGDYESCVHLAAPKIEAGARALLRELDEGIYQVQAGKDPGGYPGLYVLLDELERIALDESWALFLKWLLTGPWGANLRNDIAHGFVYNLDPTYAALLLRAAGLIITAAGPLEPPDDTGSASRVRSRAELIELLGSPVGRAPGVRERALAWLHRRLVSATCRVSVRLARVREKQFSESPEQLAR